MYEVIPQVDLCYHSGVILSIHLLVPVLTGVSAYHIYLEGRGGAPIWRVGKNQWPELSLYLPEYFSNKFKGQTKNFKIFYPKIPRLVLPGTRNKTLLLRIFAVNCIISTGGLCIPVLANIEVTN
jgi:hypothetical protein